MFAEQVEAALEDLDRRGVPRRWSAPPGYRLLWRLGVRVRPPHFQGFFTHALMVGLPVGLAVVVPFFLTAFGTGVDLGLVRWRLAGMAGVAVAAATAAGAAVGAYYRLTAWRLGLPDWDEYAAGIPADEDDVW